MIRIALVGWGDTDWRSYRQPQWMAQVRQTPEATSLPRLHFDIDEESYVRALGEWDGSSREAAVALLERQGAREVRRA